MQFEDGIPAEIQADNVYVDDDDDFQTLMREYESDLQTVESQVHEQLDRVDGSI